MENASRNRRRFSAFSASSREHHPKIDGARDLLVKPADVLAVPAQRPEPAAHVLGRAVDVAHVRMFRDDLQGALLSIAPDEDGLAGALDGRRIVARPVYGVPLPVVSGGVPTHHPVGDTYGVLQGVHPLAHVAELVAIGIELLFVPARAEAAIARPALITSSVVHILAIRAGF